MTNEDPFEIGKNRQVEKGWAREVTGQNFEGWNELYEILDSCKYGDGLEMEDGLGPDKMAQLAETARRIQEQGQKDQMIRPEESGADLRKELFEWLLSWNQD